MLDKNFWKNYFEVYDVLNLSISYQELLDEILKEIDIKNGDLVLDAGGGTGNLSILLKNKGANVINLDFCQEALDIYKKKDPNAIIVLSDLTQRLPFSDNYFDKIVSNNAIYNIDREKRMEIIKEFKRVLKPGGKIVISNLKKGFSPLKIYIDTVRKSLKKLGVLNTIKLLTNMFIPTIKMFYYNFFIQREYKLKADNFFDFNEQKDLLEKAGFTNISETKLVYAGQGIVNSGQKL